MELEVLAAFFREYPVRSSVDLDEQLDWIEANRDDQTLASTETPDDEEPDPDFIGDSKSKPKSKNKAQGFGRGNLIPVERANKEGESQRVWINPDKAKEGAKHVGASVAAWGTGRAAGEVFSKALQSAFQTHGVDLGDEEARVITETAAQSATATLLHVKMHKGLLASEVTAKYAAEVTAGFLGKIAHGGMLELVQTIGGSQYVQFVASGVAGKITGIATSETLTKALQKPSEVLGQAFLRLAPRWALRGRDRGDSAGDYGFTLTPEESEALLEVTIAAIILAVRQNDAGFGEARGDARKIWIPPKDGRDGYWRTDPRTKKVEPVKPGRNAFISKAEFDSLTALPKAYVYKKRNTYWVTDPSGKEYMVKDPIYGPSEVAKEMIASEIAAQVGIPCQWVRGIPTKVGGSALSLHEPVSGQSVSRLRDTGKLPSEYRRIDLSQSSDTYLASVLTHPDLAKIAALDVALGNYDRHDGNFFYDSTKDRFQAIDNGGALTYPILGHNLLREVSGAIKSKAVDDYTPEQRKNLSIFASTLDRITKLNPPDAIDKRLNRYTKALQGEGYEQDLYLRVAKHTTEDCHYTSRKLVDLIARGSGNA